MSSQSISCFPVIGLYELACVDTPNERRVKYIIYAHPGDEVSRLVKKLLVFPESPGSPVSVGSYLSWKAIVTSP
ncbi:MAG: hypothetical protein P8Z40_10210, partial [Chloroflexota bacterium]